MEVLVLPGNQISRMDTNSIPKNVQRLHIGRNFIKDLNKTLTNLSDINWLFINNNELKTLENELPINAPKLNMIHAAFNKIEQMPQQLKTYPMLESLFLQYNKIKRLDGSLSKSKKLQRVVLEHNNINSVSKQLKINLLGRDLKKIYSIHQITEEDFIETEELESLILGHNEITTLNNSLANLKQLNFLNMTCNYLTEFSFQEIVGLPELRSVDLSYNRISKLIGPAAVSCKNIHYKEELL